MPRESGALSAFAPAKINLFLHILGRRADGYHELESLVVFADVGDTLSFTPAPEISLTAEGPFAADLCAPEDNLVIRAARRLADFGGVHGGVHIHLDKQLPVAAGLGGGSADAAAALRGLMMLWNIRPDPPDLDALAGALGADVAVCLAGRPSVVTGRGEIVTPAPPLPRVTFVNFVIVHPARPLATAAVFAAHQGTGPPTPLPAEAVVDAPALVSALTARRNDLEAAACRLCPEIAESIALLSAEDACLLARMSGSGASCFGLFPTAAAARATAARLRTQQPSWWVVAAGLDRSA